jgi:hypothetical protein
MCCSFIAGEEIVKPTLTAKQLKAKAQKIINAMNGTIKGYLIK